MQKQISIPTFTVELKRGGDTDTERVRFGLSCLNAQARPHKSGAIRRAILHPAGESSSTFPGCGGTPALQNKTA
jgi:hypothetical protein